MRRAIGNMHGGISRDPYITFVESIPYRFYPILMLVFQVVLVLSRREFGKDNGRTEEKVEKTEEERRWREERREQRRGGDGDGACQNFEVARKSNLTLALSRFPLKLTDLVLFIFFTPSPLGPMRTAELRARKGETR